jgi:hypothetical protein
MPPAGLRVASHRRPFRSVLTLGQALKQSSPAQTSKGWLKSLQLHTVVHKRFHLQVQVPLSWTGIGRRPRKTKPFDRQRPKASRGPTEVHALWRENPVPVIPMWVVSGQRTPSSSARGMRRAMAPGCPRLPRSMSIPGRRASALSNAHQSRREERGIRSFNAGIAIMGSPGFPAGSNMKSPVVPSNSYMCAWRFPSIGMTRRDRPDVPFAVSPIHPSSIWTTVTDISAAWPDRLKSGVFNDIGIWIVIGRYFIGPRSVSRSLGPRHPPMPRGNLIGVDSAGTTEGPRPSAINISDTISWIPSSCMTWLAGFRNPRGFSLGKLGNVGMTWRRSYAWCGPRGDFHSRSFLIPIPSGIGGFFWLIWCPTHVSRYDWWLLDNLTRINDLMCHVIAGSYLSIPCIYRWKDDESFSSYLILRL